MHLEESLLTDYVDETLGAAGRADVERHLEQCAECRRLVDDFREIRRVAGSLEFREPPARAWGRLQRAIKIEQEHAAEAPPATAVAAGASRVRTWMGFAAAAAVLVLATVVGLRYMTTAPGGTRTPAAGTRSAASESATDAARSQASAAAVEAELRAAEEHYDKAIKGLEQI